jgi:hypothetical protein
VSTAAGNQVIALPSSSFEVLTAPADGNVWVKSMQARCVLISDASQACNGTLMSSSAAQVLASAADAVAECQTGGSIRLALIAVVGFIVIPIPLLLLYVDGTAGYTQALEFARKHGQNTPPEVPMNSTSDGASRNVVVDTERHDKSVAFEMTIHRPDSNEAPTASSLPPEQ